MTDEPALHADTIQIVCPACHQPVPLTTTGQYRHDCPIAQENQQLREARDQLIDVLTQTVNHLQINDAKSAFRIIRATLEQHQP